MLIRDLAILTGAIALIAPAMPRGPAEAATDTTRASERSDRVRSTAADRERIAITVYNQNFGLVREVRTIGIGTGRVELEFGDVASSIQTETVHVRALGSSPFRILEQNYQFDLLSPQKLLEKYVGRMVTVWRMDPETQREVPVEAEVLSVHNGTILRIGGEITFNIPGRITFPEVPANLIAEPTLVWLAESGAREQQLEVSYLTGGLNWKADYVMVLGEDDDEAGLTGWVTLMNASGASYEDAQLKLVAGDVQRVGRDDMMKYAARVEADAARPRQFSEEAFFEYHMYTLARPATVLNNEQKQVTLLEAPAFGVTKKLVFYGAAQYYRGSHGNVVSNQKVSVFLDFDNAERNGLGMPLPAGIMRVYKRDGSGAQQFIGEDRIDHTPRDERLRIRMGDAFDVVGDRRQMRWTPLGSCTSESEWALELRNHKDAPVRVDVVEPIGGSWEILQSSHRAERVDAHTFRFDVPVPARGATQLTYTVRVRWC